MNFAFSEEQEELRRTVRQFLEAKSPETEVRRLMETTEGYDPSVWKQMGQELGLQGLAIPEEFGGQGYTFIELGIVLEEMGRVLRQVGRGRHRARSCRVRRQAHALGREDVRDRRPRRRPDRRGGAHGRHG